MRRRDSGMKKLTPGKLYAPREFNLLTLIGWWDNRAGGFLRDAKGFKVEHYMVDQIYLGEDAEGIEPIFAKRRTRPPKYGPEICSAQFGVRMPPELAEWLKREATRRALTRNEFVIRIVRMTKTQSEGKL
jgi:hypothetical protein